MTNAYLEAFIFSLVLSIDSFVAFLGYGTSKINISFKSFFFNIFTSILILAIGILLGACFSSIKEDVAKYISFSMLLLVGLIKFFSALLKIWLAKRAKKDKPIKIKIFDFELFLNIALDPTKADLNNDKILSLGESVIIAIILSLDSLGVGFGIGLNSVYKFLIIPFAFIICLILSILGYFLGKKLAKMIKINLSWLSGLTLIILAIIKLL